MTFCLYHLKDGCTAEQTIYNEKGEAMTLRASRHQNTIAVKTTGVQKNWKLLLRGLSVTSVINGAAEALQEGTAVQPKEKNGMSSFISKRSDQDAENGPHHHIGRNVHDPFRRRFRSAAARSR